MNEGYVQSIFSPLTSMRVEIIIFQFPKISMFPIYKHRILKKYDCNSNCKTVVNSLGVHY